MNTRDQIRKYKIQINELLNVWQTSRQREINIHKAELDRIAAKTLEFRECCSIDAENLRTQKMAILDEITIAQAKLDNIVAALAQLHNTKFKLRQEVLLQIHAENRVKKDIKRNRLVFEKQLADLQSQIHNHQNTIDNYETNKRHINEDFYNWRNECAETQQKILELDPSDKKAKILKTYLAELELDTRANPETRYALLDEQKTQCYSLIEQLGYQYNKLHTYMNNINETLVSQGEQVMSSYLRDASAEIPRLKTEQKELTEKIDSLWKRITEIEQQITELGNKDIPDELKEQTDRAEQRLRISGERLASEYEPIINKLRAQVSILEQELINTVLQPELTNNIILNQGNQPRDTLLLETDDITEQVIDLPGKTRKEIERLKKQQRA
jgi:chromosome segregation ATPase